MRSVMRAYEEEHKAISRYKSFSDTSYETKKRIAREAACHDINEYYDNMRRAIDLEMQKYIIEHDGVIDSRCDSEGAFVKSFENDKYKFEYQ